jgi:hypothetical protein
MICSDPFRIEEGSCFPRSRNRDPSTTLRAGSGAPMVVLIESASTAAPSLRLLRDDFRRHGGPSQPKDEDLSLGTPPDARILRMTILWAYFRGLNRLRKKSKVPRKIVKYIPQRLKPASIQSTYRHE